MAAESGFTITRSPSETTITVFPADEYSDINLRTANAFNHVGTGCIAIFSLFGGLLFTAAIAGLLSDVDFFENNDWAAGLALLMSFIPVTYMIFIKLWRWDKRKSTHPYKRHAEAITINNQSVKFGSQSIALESILSIDAGLPQEFGDGNSSLVYSDDVRGESARIRI